MPVRNSVWDSVDSNAMNRMTAIPLVLLVLAAAPAAAQSQSPQALTLEEAIARGLAASHRLAEATARGEAAAARAIVQRASRLPQLGAQAGYYRTNHVETFGLLLPNNEFKVIYPDVPDNYRTRLDLQWPIYTGGRLDALERAARAEAAASSDDLQAARADLKLEITRAYWALAMAIEAVQVVEESLARADTHLRDVRNQLAAGLVAPNDVASAEAQEARQRMLREQAHAARDNAAAELARLVGLPLDADIEPTSALAPPPPAGAPIAALLAEARAARPDRAALAKRAAAAAERRQAAQAGARPVIGIAGGFDYARPNPRIFPREAAWRDSWDAGLNVTWPIFDGGRARGELADAAAAARAAEERLAEFDAALDLEIRQRVRELDAARAALPAADEAVRSAAEARRVVADRFAAGVAVSADVVDAQVALLQAELDRTQALANARLAEARLARALGR